MYFIINKIEYKNESVVYTPIGYTTDLIFRDEINNSYESTMGIWIENNKNELESGEIDISVFFETNPVVYVAKTYSDTNDGLNEINEI